MYALQIGAHLIFLFNILFSHSLGVTLTLITFKSKIFIYFVIFSPAIYRNISLFP